MTQKASAFIVSGLRQPGGTLYRVKLNTVPENGALRETGLLIGLDELDLGEPFSGKGITADYELRRIEDQVSGKFRLKGSVSLNCSRCLTDFTRELEADFLVEFSERPADPNPRHDDDAEPGPHWAWIENGLLPVGEEMRQEMELCVPFVALCREDCKGLCPECGGNRNLKPCDCEPKREDSPFSKLKNLFDRPKEN